MKRIILIIVGILLVETLLAMTVEQQVTVTVLPETGILTIYSPINPVYSERRIPFNLTIQNKAKIIEYIDYSSSSPRWRRLCSNCDEYGFSNLRKKSFSSGEHNITIRAIGDTGTYDEKNITFFVDYTNPRILKIEPRSKNLSSGVYLTKSTNSKIIKSSYFYVEFKEENPISLTLTLKGNETKNYPMNISECTLDNSYKECALYVNLTEFNGQEVEYYFTLVDIAGNQDISNPREIKVDTTNPVINNPDSFWYYKNNTRYVYFDINITEENLDEVSYSYMDYNNRLRERTICSRLKNGFCERKQSFRRGDYNLTISALDEAGNFIEKEILFTVDY